jgi:hypothetical protein
LLPLALLCRHSVSPCPLHGSPPLLLGLLLLLPQARHTWCGLLLLGPASKRRGCCCRIASCSGRTNWRRLRLCLPLLLLLCLLLLLLCLLGLLLPSHLVRLLLEGGPAGLGHKRCKAVEKLRVGAQQRQRRRQQSRHILVLLVSMQL